MLLEPADAWLSREVGRRAWILLAALVGTCALVAGVNGAHDPVLFHHFALARRLFEGGLLPSGDPILAPGLGAPGPFPCWLASVALYVAEAAAGRPAVLALAAGGLAIGVVAAWFDGVDHEPSPTWLDAAIALPAALLVMAVARERAGPRPEVLAAAFLGLTLLLARRLADGRGDHRVIFALLVPLGVLWANVDGSWLLGVAVLAASAAETAARARRGGSEAPPLRRAVELATLALAGLLATLVAPWPGAPLAAVGQFLAAIGRASPGAAARGLGAHGMALLFLATGALLLAGRRARGADVALAILGALLAVAAPSHAHLAAILWFPGIVRSLRAAVAQAAPRARRGVAAVALGASILAALAVVRAPGVELGLEPHYELEPVRATDLLGEAGFKGTVYTSPATGAYLAWRLGVRVTADVRPGAWLGPPLETGNVSTYVDQRWRFDAAALSFATGERARDAGACGDEGPPDPARAALVGYDDAAMLYVRRDGALGALAAREYRVALPCAEIGPADLASADWRVAFADEARRLALESPQCGICRSAENLAKAAVGELPAPGWSQGSHPVLQRHRKAALALSDALAATAAAQARAGDLPGAIARYWLAVQTAGTARSRAGLALALLQLGEPAAALEEGRRALALDPALPDARLAAELAGRALRSAP